MAENDTGCNVLFLMPIILQVACGAGWDKHNFIGKIRFDNAKLKDSAI